MAGSPWDGGARDAVSGDSDTNVSVTVGVFPGSGRARRPGQRSGRRTRTGHQAERLVHTRYRGERQPLKRASRPRAAKPEEGPQGQVSREGAKDGAAHTPRAPVMKPHVSSSIVIAKAETSHLARSGVKKGHLL